MANYSTDLIYIVHTYVCRYIHMNNYSIMYMYVYTCAHIKNHTVSICTKYFIHIKCFLQWNPRCGSFQNFLSLHTWHVSIIIQFKILVRIYTYKICLQFVHNHSNFLLWKLHNSVMHTTKPYNSFNSLKHITITM